MGYEINTIHIKQTMRVLATICLLLVSMNFVMSLKLNQPVISLAKSKNRGLMLAQFLKHLAEKRMKIKAEKRLAKKVKLAKILLKLSGEDSEAMEKKKKKKAAKRLAKKEGKKEWLQDLKEKMDKNDGDDQGDDQEDENDEEDEENEEALRLAKKEGKKEWLQDLK